MRKPAFCTCENKYADQLCGNRTADQRLCFRYVERTIFLPPISEISSLLPSCVVVQSDLCRTWSETPKTGFLTTRLICKKQVFSIILFSKPGPMAVCTRPSTRSQGRCWQSSKFPSTPIFRKLSKKYLSCNNVTVRL